MLICFKNHTAENKLPIQVVEQSAFPAWLAKQSTQLKNWLDSSGFEGKAGKPALLPDESGRVAAVLVLVEDLQDMWAFGGLAMQLPAGNYFIDADLTSAALDEAAIAWGLGAYQFTDYKDAERQPACLCLPKQCYSDLVENIVESTYLVRDLINTPAEDMGPLELSETAMRLSEEFHAQFDQIVGEDLLDEMYPAVFTVGRGSYSSPRLLDLQWGDLNSPKLTLVGKGVCYDTGGLDIKTGGSMRLMKKDMGGAAHVLGLARMIMKANLPVRLRVLIPAVENSVSGDAYRPGDVITMRNGKTVEVDNTDAEGRLVLADALVEASSEKPDLLIDFATLTGAARVAVGTEIAAMFTNNDKLAECVAASAEHEKDPVWRMPLHQSYLKLLKSKIADIANCARGGYAGAITAALFLQQFIDQEITWLHFDVMGWNVADRAGHPEGGEAMGLRAVFSYLRQRFSSQH